MPQFRYDEDLVEQATFLCASRAGRVPPLQAARFHRERERLYLILDPDQRNDAFFQLNLEWFREWGLEKRLLAVTAEFPILQQRLALFALRKARSAKEEAAELFVNESGAAHGVLALRPERLLEGDTLEVFLRHELTHLSDMVDPAFGYARELPLPAANPAQRKLAHERYRLLWDLTIDGRLAAAGQVSSGARERHQAAFHRAYGFLPEPGRSWLFEQLWADPRPRHAALAELACDPRGLRETPCAVPGGPCPLCDFPTFDWVKGAALSSAVRARITSEFPAWTPEQDVCGRCAQVYQVAVRSGLPDLPLTSKMSATA